MKNLLYTILLVSLSSHLLGQTLIRDNYKNRKSLVESADSAILHGGNYYLAIQYYKKVAATDQDTMLIAAKAYDEIVRLFSFQIQNPVAAEKYKVFQKKMLDSSLFKYPENEDGYIDKLNFYKYASDTSGQKEHIERMKTKFKSSAKSNFELAYHNIKSDFLWKGAPDFEETSGYLKKVLILDPSHFNARLLLSTAYEDDKALRSQYLKEMYALAPQQFHKNTMNNAANYPYQIQSKHEGPLLYHELTVAITKSEALALALIKK